MAHRSQRRQSSTYPSLEAELQTLKDELDAARKEGNHYAHLIAALYGELHTLRKSLCYNCSKKFVPGYIGGLPTSPPLDGPRVSRPSAPRSRRTSIGRRSTSTASAADSTSSFKLTTSPPSQPSITPTLAPVLSLNAGADASVQTTSSRMITADSSQPADISSDAASDRPVNEEESSNLEPEINTDWTAEYNPKIPQGLSLRVVHTHSFTFAVSSVKFSPNGKYLAIGLCNGRTYIYDVTSGSKICVFVDLYEKTEVKTWGVQFSPDSKYLATAGDDKAIRVWEVAQKRTQALFKGHGDTVNSVAFSPDSRFLVSGSDDHSIRIWRIRDGSFKELTDNASFFLCITFSPDGRYIAAANYDGWLRIWDARTRQLVEKWKAHTLHGWSVAVTADGNGLASGGEDCKLKYWDVSPLALNRPSTESSTGKKEIFEFEGHTDNVTSVVFSPDNRWLLSSSGDCTLRIWDLGTFEWQTTLRGHKNAARAVDFSLVGNYLSSGGDDGWVTVWTYELV